MAALIIEVAHRLNAQYHPVEGPVVRAGRALDNDIILPDPAVSPYHFAVRRGTDGEYRLYSLADENGIRIGGRRVSDPVRLDHLPLEFDAGRTRIRILDRSQPVAPTRLISCMNGGLCVFGHWGWAIALLMLALFASGVENYLATPQVLNWESFWRDQFVISTAILALSVGLLLVNRITSHRWDYPSSLSFVSLALIVGFLLDQSTHFADYFFTSPLPGYLAAVGWSLVLLPFALGWFLIRFNHGNTASSVALVIFILTPSAYLHTREALDHYRVPDTFNKKAFYSRSLHPWDKRLEATRPIDDFADRNLLISNYSSASSEELIKQP